MAEPARLNYLISSCDKFWQCGELRRKRSRAVTQWIFLRLARVKFKRLSYSHRSFRPHCSVRLPRLCIFYRAHGSLYLCASVFLRRGCYAVYQNIKARLSPRMQALAGNERIKFRRAISLIRDRGIFDPCRPCYSATNEPFAKTCRGMPPKYSRKSVFLARDLQKYVAVHRSRIAAAFEIYLGLLAR